MYHYNSARAQITPRVLFDPGNKKHREGYAYFLKHRSWPRDLHFYLEWPYVNIPAMCQDRLTRYFLKVPQNDFREYI